jgi:hypothetical protein
MSSSKELVKMLNNGILPDALRFDGKQKEQTDEDLMQMFHNWFHKDYSDFEKKFPPGYESIPGFNKIIESMVENQLTPLEELEIRKNKNLDSNNNVPTNETDNV